MKTLDRYIVRTFLLNFAILFVVLMSLFVVVDLIVDLDEFLEAGEFWARERQVRALVGPGVDSAAVTAAIYDRLDARSLSEAFGLSAEAARRAIDDTEPGAAGSAVGTLVKIADYYGPMIVLIYVFFSGLLVVAAMGFTLAAMSRALELTAIVASGVSLYRVAAPVLVTGIALNALTLPAQEFLIPAVAAKLARSKSKLEHEAIENFPVQFAPDDNHNLLSAAEFDAVNSTLHGLFIIDRDADGRTERHVTAHRATWDERGSRWLLVGGRARSVGEAGLQGGESELAEFPTRLSPQLLLARRATIYSRLLPLADLRAMQNNQAVDRTQRATITQIIWGRFSLLVLSVLILVMGLPFFLVRAPQNPLLAGVRAAAVCLGAWGGGLVMMQIGAGGLNPVAAAWLPVVIYLPVSALLLQTVKT